MCYEFIPLRLTRLFDNSANNDVTRAMTSSLTIAIEAYRYFDFSFDHESGVV